MGKTGGRQDMRETYGQALADFPESITDKVRTPCYIVSTGAIKRNLEILDSVQTRTGAKILLALKAYAMWSTFPLIRKYLHGVCASGPIEARLGREEFGGEVHTFSPAYSEEGMEEVIRYSDRIIFNSIYQWKKYRGRIRKANEAGRRIEAGLRVNPGHSEVKVKLYDPAGKGSRLGIRSEDLEGEDLEGVSGLHFHALCEQDADVLVRVLESFEKRFGKYVRRMKWVNFGGGHHITRKGYDVELLCRTITGFRKRYGVEVYLEPGEAVVLNAGVLVASVLDIVKNGAEIAILDTSAETHMPDVLAMPYRPNVIGAGRPGEFRHAYRLGGISCLAGDVIGEYSFESPLRRGERLVFLDMALYSFVKNTTFNGIGLPSLAVYEPESGKLRSVRKFGYDDYKTRLS
jgi:carboxynorspermidine decarboxylase